MAVAIFDDIRLVSSSIDRKLLDMSYSTSTTTATETRTSGMQPARWGDTAPLTQLFSHKGFYQINIG